MESRATDWRAQLRRNESRTKIVMALFVLMYLFLGFLIDMLYYSSLVSQTNIYMSEGSILFQTFQGLLTLHFFPYFTLTATIVAVISIWITYHFHDAIMLLGTQHHEVTSTSPELAEKQLYNVVEEMKVASGLRFMPKVYIIEADYMNAFASGVSEKSAMVAITRGLMQKLNRAELQAVMAHELSHIRHQDIKLTVVASILANLMLIVIDILFYSLVAGRRKNNNALVLVIILLRYILPLVTMLLMLYLSRTREYMADSGAVELMRDNQPLANALIKIHQDHAQNVQTYSHAYEQTKHEQVRQAAYLYDPAQFNMLPHQPFASLFSTHPSLEERLTAIGYQHTDEKSK